MTLSFVGESSTIATDGSAPGAITPHASTQAGDLLIFRHYSAVTGNDRTVGAPAGFTEFFNQISSGRGLICGAYRVYQAGDTTFTASVTNHPTGTTGDAILEKIDTWRGHGPIPVAFTSTSLSTSASSATVVGPIDAAGITSVPPHCALIVVWGRHDDSATPQTLLTGESLTWTAPAIVQTSAGSDATMGFQYGINDSSVSQTSITSKTVTLPTSSSATAAGFMFVIRTMVAYGTVGPTGLQAVTGAIG